LLQYPIGAVAQAGHLQESRASDPDRFVLPLGENREGAAKKGMRETVTAMTQNTREE
jgi:hypothetical protein